MNLKSPRVVLSVAFCALLLAGCGDTASSDESPSLPEAGSFSAETSTVPSAESAEPSEVEVPSSSNTNASEASGADLASRPSPESESETPVDGDREPPLSERDLRVPAPDFLTGEQQLLYRRAYKMMIVRIGTYAIDSTDYFPCDAPDTTRTYDDQLTLDGRPYVPALNHYQSWDLFYNTLESIFTEDFLESDYLSAGETAYFRPVEGRLYYLPTERGTSAGYDQDTTKMEFALLDESPDQIDIQVTATYAVDETGSQAFRQAWLDGLVSNTKNYTITMQQTEEGWRFSRFDVPF